MIRPCVSADAWTDKDIYTKASRGHAILEQSLPRFLASCSTICLFLCYPLEAFWIACGSQLEVTQTWQRIVFLFCWIQLCSSSLDLSILLKGLGAETGDLGAHLLLKSRESIIILATPAPTVAADWGGGDDGHGDRQAHPVQRLDELLLPPCSHRTQPQRWVGDSSTSWNSGLWSWLDCFGWLFGITELDLTE